MIVQQMLIKYPQASFDIMTPEAAKELLSGKSVTGHPGVSECVRFVTADELLNQEVISSNYSDNVWHILSNFPQMEQDSASPEQGVKLC